MCLNDFIILNEIGKGAFGSVYRAKRIQDGELYALKQIDISILKEKEKENCINEVRLLASIDHPNIVSYKDAFYDNDSQSLNIIMEYMDDGDLEMKIHQIRKNKEIFKENEIWNYLLCMVNGLKCLHDNKIMHRDIKAANIFINKSGCVKIGDLNISKIIKTDFLQTQIGTPFYSSPEIWKEKPYDFKSDIWSLGCIVFELCSLRAPFRGSNMDDIFKKVIKGKVDHIPNIYSEFLNTIIIKMIKVDPSMRLTCDEILKYIESVNNSNGCNSNSNIVNNINSYIDNNDNPNNYPNNTSNIVTNQTNIQNTERESKEYSNDNILNMLNTIKIPKNFKKINKILPKNKYKIIINPIENTKEITKEFTKENSKCYIINPENVFNSIDNDNYKSEFNIKPKVKKKNVHSLENEKYYSQALIELPNQIINENDNIKLKLRKQKENKASISSVLIASLTKDPTPLPKHRKMFEKSDKDSNNNEFLVYKPSKQSINVNFNNLPSKQNEVDYIETARQTESNNEGEMINKKINRNNHSNFDISQMYRHNDNQDSSRIHHKANQNLIDSRSVSPVPFLPPINISANNLKVNITKNEIANKYKDYNKYKNLYQKKDIRDISYNSNHYILPSFLKKK